MTVTGLDAERSLVVSGEFVSDTFTVPFFPGVRWS